MRFVLHTEPPLRKKSANKTPGKENVPENQLPNSLIMRMMQDEAAEREADALSKGVSSFRPIKVSAPFEGSVQT